MKSLIWKQWREDRGYLAIFLTWMVIAACYCIGYETANRFRAAVGQFSGWAMLYSICAAVLLAMRAAQGEKSEGTSSFSASLPISLPQIAAVKIGGAMVTLAIPIVVACFLLSLALISGLIEQVGPRGIGPHFQLPQRDASRLPTALEQLASVTAIAVFGGVELLLILSLLGNWLRSKAQVGLLGAVLGLGSMIAAGLLWYGERKPFAQLVYGAVFPQSLVIHWGYGTENGSTYTDHELAPYRWFSLTLAIPLLLLLATLFVTKYGQPQSSGSASKQKRFRLNSPAIWSYLPLRLPGRCIALIWLELRQALPLVTFGLLFALLIAVASAFIEPQANASIGASTRAEMPHTIAFVGILWAAVVGSGLYSADLSAGLGTFWRSRPISPGMWFWCKFVVGLVAVLGILDGVTILLSWHSPRDTMTSGMSWSYIACFPALHAMLYALAVLGTCWLRKPVIGCFFAFFGYTLMTLAISTFPATIPMEPVNVYNQLLAVERGGQVDFTQHGYPLVYGAIAFSTLLFAWFASRLARPLQPVFHPFSSLSAS